MDQLTARLDRIPITKSIFFILFLLSLVWLAEAFDLGVVGPAVTILVHLWHLTPAQTGLLGVSSTLGVVLGMIPSGFLADRVGRKKVILFGMVWFSVITFTGAFAQNETQLFWIRLLAGAGEGAVLPMPYLFVSEFIHKRRRAFGVGISNGILTAAYAVPYLVSAYAIHHFSADIAWRIPFALGAVPLLFAVFVALYLPESPRFLLKSGQLERLERFILRLEREAHLQASDVTTLPQASGPVQIKQEKNENGHFSVVYAMRSFIVIAQLTAALILFYALQVFGPTFFIAQGFTATNSIYIVGSMMLIAGFGSVLQGALAEKFGRKKILFWYVILTVLGTTLFLFAGHSFLVYPAGFLTSFFGLGIFPVSKLSVAEQFPNAWRGSGVYVGEMMARAISGVCTLYFIPTLLQNTTSTVLLFSIGIVFLVLSIPFLWKAQETYQKTIEETGSIPCLT